MLLQAAVLSCLRQAGFTAEELRELGWQFSSSLWRSHDRPPGRLEPVLERPVVRQAGTEMLNID